AFLSQSYSDATKLLAGQIALGAQTAKQKFGQNQARLLIEGQKQSDEFIRAGKLPQVSWEKIVEHIHNAVRLVGADHVGLGSAFDGALMREGREDASNFPQMAEGLLGLGYGETEIAAILGENTLRVLAESERVARELQSGRG